MALWASAEADLLGSHEPELAAAARFLLRHSQPDGGVYDPERGLAAYTSGVAANAFRALRARGKSPPQIEEALPPLELFVYRQTAPESLVDAEAIRSRPVGKAADQAAALLKASAGLSANERGALEFIARAEKQPLEKRPLRTRLPGWRLPGAGAGSFGYDDLLPFLYQPLELDFPQARRAYEAVQLHYTLEQNPDLTKRYGDTGFVGGNQGLYYYYLTLAKTLATFRSPAVTVRGSERHDWPRELSTKLLSLQTRAGYWVNSDEHWWEDEPVLVTSYVMLSLDLCRDARKFPERP
jgi:hypothetical protein